MVLSVVIVLLGLVVEDVVWMVLFEVICVVVVHFKCATLYAEILESIVSLTANLANARTAVYYSSVFFMVILTLLSLRLLSMALMS